MGTIGARRRTVGALHVIVDSLAGAEAALNGGAPVVQVRVKSGTDRRRFELAQDIVDRCAGTGTLCLINDRLDFALAAGADGVHLGADDLPVAAARRVAPEGFVIGASALGSSAAEVIACIDRIADHVDYVGVGPVYATTSKADVPEAMGEAELETVVRRCDLPVVAISGITEERVPALLATGVRSVAVIGAVSQAPDPVKAVVRLRELLDGKGGVVR